MNILFFQVVSNSTKPYSDLYGKINKSYCLQYGYDYEQIISTPTEGYHYTWSKIFTSIDLLKNNKNYEYYFCLDADAAVINKNIKIESIIERMKHNISFSENGLNGGLLIATGGFIFNTKALNIFEDCVKISNELSKYKQCHWYEMAIINHMHENGYEMDVFDMNTMNSYGYIDINNPALDSLFVYHCQGRNDEEKRLIAQDVFTKYHQNTN